MFSPSEKFNNFVSEPMGDKPVTELSGVGEALGARLAEAGYDKAHMVLAQFLMFKKDPDSFQRWMKDVCNANAKQSSDCYRCLDDWCEEFL